MNNRHISLDRAFAPTPGLHSLLSSPESPDPLLQASAIIADGGIVAFPTETVYGLGAAAYDAEAVARVFEVKRRPRFDPLIVHVSCEQEARQVAQSFPDMARLLVQVFWPGPLTLVLPKSARVPGIVTAGLPAVGVRMPDHPVALELIRRAGVPVAAPSANPFGHISPTTADHVREQLGDQIDMVLDGGPCRVGIESTVLALTGGTPVLLRAGGVPAEEIEDVIGPIASLAAANSEHPTSPGQLSRHYAPRTPLSLVGPGASAPADGRVGLLAFAPPPDQGRFAAVEVLSALGDLREAAANLFSAMHRLDAMGLDAIYAVRVPEHGLGLAINDRLDRASRAGANQPLPLQRNRT